jgi:monoamine oxidase
MEADNYNKQPSNPSDEQRYALLKDALREVGRQEDYNNILKLLNPPPAILNYSYPGEFKGMKIGIIGGGLAGMSAAFELRKLGCNITIFEAEEKRIGGRVHTHYFDEHKKLYGELGAMRIPIAHQTTWHYINLFKLSTEPFIQSNPNAFLYVRNTRIRNNPENIKNKIYPKYNLNQREKNTSWTELYDYALNYPIKKLNPYIRTEFLKVLPKYNPEYNTLLNISIRQNFEMLGLSAEAIDLITSVDPFTGSLVDIAYNEILQENYPVDFSYLYRVSGGNVYLPLAFYKSLTSEKPKEYNTISQNDLGLVKWRSGNWVTGIYKSKNNNQVLIKYKNKSISKSALEGFDYVVCAIPFSTLRAVEIDPVFSNRKMQAIKEINYVNGQKTLLLCNRRFWEENESYGKIQGGISTTDLLITDIIYPSDHVSKANPYEPGVLVGSYNLNKDASHLGNIDPEIRSEIVKRQIERVHGLPEKYLDSVVDQSKYINWNNEQWFRGAVALFTPEQKRIFSYDLLEPEYNNRVFFAGEHTSATHAWMQGALNSGVLAANKIVHNCSTRKYKK